MNWRPSASFETLKARAKLLSAIREFFHQRSVLEVDTPMLSHYGTVDRHIDSFGVFGPQPPAPSPSLWLHTSPEFGMKRLLAAGSGPIYQMCHVFRAEQPGRFHNPEFMMLEWYRPGWDHHQLMDEVEAFFKAVIPAGVIEKDLESPALALGAAAQARAHKFERLSYQAAFTRHTSLDPYSASVSDLQSNLAAYGVALPVKLSAEEQQSRDFWLDLWMGAVVAPRLGVDAPCFIYDFPASQAALARVRPGSPPLAERFELFWQGIELANGFHELTAAAEQRARFEADRAWRTTRGLISAPPYDELLLAALEAGLPPCAGVALGVDRLLMLKLGLKEIAQVLPFDTTRA